MSDKIQSSAAGAATLPDQIVWALRELIRRRRTAIVIRGLCATAGASGLALLCVMALDAAMVLFSAWPRWTLSGAWAAVTLLAAYVTILLPLAKSFTLTGMARIIEGRHPEMHERISSALQLLSSPDRPELRGSDQLIAALAVQATTEALALQPRREITLAAAKPFAIAAGAALAILMILFIAWPDRTRQLFVRAIAPGANLPNIQAADLLVQPGSITIAQGSRLQVQATVKDARAKSAEFRWVDANAAEHIEPMASLGAQDQEPRFTFTCTPASSSFRYRVRAGDALSAYYEVQVVPPPAPEQVSMSFVYPEYTGRKSSIQTQNGPIKAPVGTTVRLSVLANKPLASAQVLVQTQSSQVVEARLLPDQRQCEAVVQLTPGLKGKWTLRLLDQQGFSCELPWQTIESQPDLPPQARFIAPQETSLRLSREDRLPLSFVFSDDHGLGRIELRVSGEKGLLATVDLAGGKAMQKIATGSYVLDLSQLKLGDSRALTVQLRVLDNLPADNKGPQEGLSSSIGVQLDALAPSYVVQVQMAHELRIRSTLQEVLGHLTAAKEQSSALRKLLARLEQLNPPAVERIDEMLEHLGAAQKPLSQLIDQIAGGNFGPLALRLKELDDSHVSKAYNLAGQLKIVEVVKDRGELADEADFQVDRAIAIVSDMLKDLSVMTELARRTQALSELAQKQQELAAQKVILEQATTMPASATATNPAGAPAAMSAQELAEAQKAWQQRQAAVAAAMNEMVKQTRGALGLRANQELQTTRNLVDDARQLAQQQTALIHQTQQAIALKRTQVSLAELAAQQVNLAEQAAVEESLKDVAQAMARLAKELAAPQENTPNAFKPIQEQLAQQAKANQQLRQGLLLSQQASELDQTQQNLAKKVKDNSVQTAAQTEAAAAANAQEKVALAEKQKVQQELKGLLDELQKAQQDLAAKAVQIEQSLKPLAPANVAAPGASMSNAAAELRGGNLLQASASAKEAAQKCKEQSAGASAALSQLNKVAADRSHLDQAKLRLQAAQDQARKALAQASQAAEAAQHQLAQAKVLEQAMKKEQAKDQQAQAVLAAAQTKAKQLADASAAADKKASDSEAAARAARQQADAAKAQNAPDAAQKEAAAQAAATKALADRSAANAARDQAVQAAAQVVTAKTEAQKTRLEAVKQEALSNVAAKAATQAEETKRQTQQQMKTLQDAAGVEQTQAQKAQADLDKAAATAVQATAAAAAAKELEQGQGQLAEKIQQIVAGPGARLIKAQDDSTRARAKQTQHEQEAARLKGQLQLLGNEQRALSGKAAAIVKGSEAADAEFAKAASRENPAQQLLQAAANGSAGKHSQAVQSAQAAAEKTSAFAKALAQSLPAQAPTIEKCDQIGKSISQVSASQSQLGAKAMPLLKEHRRQLQAQAHASLTRMRAEQDRLAKRAAELADRVKELAPQTDRLETAAARSSSQALEQLQGSRPGDAAFAARQAADQLAELARRLGADEEDIKVPASAPATTPATGKADQVVAKGSTQQEPEQVRLAKTLERSRKKQRLPAEAASLARRQQQLAQELSATVDDQAQKALAARQQIVAARTADLAADIELLNQHSLDLIPQPAVRSLADQSSAHMQTAQAHQAVAQKNLEGGTLDQSVQPQQESARAIGAAASSMEQMGQQLAQAAAKDAAPADPAQQEESGYLARVAEQTDEAARNEQAKDAIRAARLLSELANLSANRAMQVGVMPLDVDQLAGSGGMTGQSLGRGGLGFETSSLSPEQLEALGLTASDWARLPGQLRDEVLQAAAQESPEEYRAIIKQYFQEISRRGSQTQEKK